MSPARSEPPPVTMRVVMLLALALLAGVTSLTAQAPAAKLTVDDRPGASASIFRSWNRISRRTRRRRDASSAAR